MKVSQKGIEEVKKDPELVDEVGWWLAYEYKSTRCPFETCDICKQIFPELEPIKITSGEKMLYFRCPCRKYPDEINRIIQIAKQIVGEE